MKRGLTQIKNVSYIINIYLHMIRLKKKLEKLANNADRKPGHEKFFLDPQF